MTSLVTAWHGCGSSFPRQNNTCKPRTHVTQTLHKVVAAHLWLISQGGSALCQLSKPALHSLIHRLAARLMQCSHVGLCMARRIW